MTSSVTAPLERQFGQMAGLNQMTSASSAAPRWITLQFSLTLSLDVAEQEVQAAINAASSLLPGDLPVPPVYAKVNPGRRADPDTGGDLKKPRPDFAGRSQRNEPHFRRYRNSRASGSSASAAGNGRRCAVQGIDPQSLAAYGLNVADLRTTLSNANVNIPKGNFDGPSLASTIDTDDQLHHPRRIP